MWAPEPPPGSNAHMIALGGTLLRCYGAVQHLDVRGAQRIDATNNRQLADGVVEAADDGVAVDVEHERRVGGDLAGHEVGWRPAGVRRSPHAASSQWMIVHDGVAAIGTVDVADDGNPSLDRWRSRCR